MFCSYIVHFKKFKGFWRKANEGPKWKLQVYNAVIFAQLVYGLETVHSTESQGKRLDAFQAKGLRQLLKIDHSFYSRITNEDVMEKANIVANKGTNLTINWVHFLQFKTNAKENSGERRAQP